MNSTKKLGLTKIYAWELPLSQSTKKLGGIYKDWDQLDCFPECYKWSELVEKFPNINKDTLFVYCDRDNFKLGEIIKLKTDDGTSCLYFTNGENVCLAKTDTLAVLPAEIGDIYEDWKQLKRFSECYTWSELVEKFPKINEETLFVYCGGEQFERGEIVKLEKEGDGIMCPVFTNGKKITCLTTRDLALLPVETEAAEKPEDNTEQFTVGSKQLEGALEELEKKGWKLSNLILREGNSCSTATLTIERSFETILN